MDRGQTQECAEDMQMHCRHADPAINGHRGVEGALKRGFSMILKPICFLCLQICNGCFPILVFHRPELILKPILGDE